MSKYLRTKINHKKVIAKIDGCDCCPIMKFNIHSQTSLCKLYENEYNSKWVDKYVIYFNEKGFIYENIDIPNWCKLPNSIEELYKDNYLLTPFLSCVMKTYIIDKSDDKKLPIIDIRKFKDENDYSVLEYLSSFANRDKTYDEWETNKQNNLKVYSKICSNCGKDNDSVTRDKKFGMCGGCWDLYKDDKDIKIQSYINNFRLKRNVNFTNETFKTIQQWKNINI